jgi:uncharacterized membrane protein YjjP (DUF1212 family)
VSVVWAIRKGKEKGPYVAVLNHTTNRNFFDDDAIIDNITKYSKNTRTIALAFLAIIVFLFFLGKWWLSLFLLIIAGPVLTFVQTKIIGKQKANEFKSKYFDFSDFK